MQQVLACAILIGTACAPGGAAEPRFYRGNTHTHTLWSDGDGAPEQVADWYKNHGYDFLVLSDHNIVAQGERWFPVSDAKGSRLTAARLAALRQRFGADAVVTRGDDGALEMRLQTLDELRTRFEEPGRFLFIPGEEVTASYDPRDGSRSLPVHINAINTSTLVEPQGGSSAVEVMNRNVDAIVAQGKADGRPVLAHINHPNFGFALTWRDVAAVTNDRFFEVYNGHRGVHNAGDAEHDSTERIWDRALTLRLTGLDLGILYGLATDDAHSYHAADQVSIPGRGFVMVRAGQLAADAIVTAMRHGDFYATTGVTLLDFAHDAQELRVTIAPRDGETCVTRFIGTTRTADTIGEIGATLAETTDNPARYRFRGDELYVRAVVTSSLLHPDPATPGDRQMAWVQPVLPAR